MSEQPEPYRIPLIRNPRRMGYAVDCTTCGKQIRMGPHSAKSARRLIDMFGALCSECRVEDPA